MRETSGLRVAIFGATGVAGGAVLDACLRDARIGRVVCVVRRSTGRTHQKLHEVRCDDFASLGDIGDALHDLDVVFYCLGIPQSQAPDEATYRTITFDYTLAAARAVLAASPGAVFHFISGSGTNPDSRQMWARIKGETEIALQDLGLAGLVIWRPGMIVPDRAPAGWPLAYKISIPFARVLRFVRSLSVRADELGRAMVDAAAAGRTTGILNNRDIRDLADAAS